MRMEKGKAERLEGAQISEVVVGYEILSSYQQASCFMDQIKPLTSLSGLQLLEAMCNSN